MPRKPEVANLDDLRVLKLVADLTPEGTAVPASSLQEAGVESAALGNLQRAGWVELVDDDGDPAVTITADGLATLHDQPSLS